MTVSEMVLELWETLGEPTDLDPYIASSIDVSAGGGLRLLNWINRGYKRVCSYKSEKTMRPIFFKSMEDWMLFNAAVESGSVTSATDNTVVLAGLDANDDQYNGWIVHIDDGTGEGQKRFITDWDGGTLTATLNKDWTTNPDSTSTFKLYKRFNKYLTASDDGASDNIIVDRVGKFGTIFKVTDLEDEFELGLRERTTFFPYSVVETGTPSVYWEYGNALWFDVAPDTARAYEIKYLKNPASLTATTDEPDIPEHFHEAILMYALWIGLSRDQESGEAYSKWRSFRDYMETAVQEQALSNKYERNYVTIGDYYGNVE